MRPYRKSPIRKCPILAAFILLLLLPGAAAGATIFDPSADFSLASNPNGVWTYGAATTLGLLIPYTATATFDGVDAWHGAAGIPEFCCLVPNVYHNGTAVTQHPYGTTSIPPGTLALHPGGDGTFSVIRWTAPAPGTYKIDATFRGVSIAAPTTTDVHVLKNGSSLFSGEITGDSQSFITTAGLLAGDTIDFAVGFGTDGNFFFDSTGLSVTIIGVFAGTPGQPNCHGASVSALARQFRGINAAASALGFPSVDALQNAIRAFCL